MRLFHMRATHFAPIAPVAMMAAQTIGMNAIVFQLLLLTIAVALLMAFKGLSLKFAFQTAVGFSAYRQMEAMKAHVATPIREQIEKGNFDFSAGKTLENAVIGIVDIIGSSQISNQVGLQSDFQLKQEFLNVATQRARQSNILILNHTGDGFVFLANPEQNIEWKKNLIEFYTSIVSDFKIILHNINQSSNTHICAGVRFGAAKGDVMMGCLGSNPTHYTAVGTAVNLAARLCAKADSNEMVLSEGVWSDLSATLPTIEKKFKSYDLKGFAKSIASIHISFNRLVTAKVSN